MSLVTVVLLILHRLYRFPEGFAAYGTAKVAMIQLTIHASLDLAPRARVNAIAPGAIKTSALDIVLTMMRFVPWFRGHRCGG